MYLFNPTMRVQYQPDHISDPGSHRNASHGRNRHPSLYRDDPRPQAQKQHHPTIQTHGTIVTGTESQLAYLFLMVVSLISYVVAYLAAVVSASESNRFAAPNLRRTLHQLSKARIDQLFNYHTTPIRASLPYTIRAYSSRATDASVSRHSSRRQWPHKPSVNIAA